MRIPPMRMLKTAMLMLKTAMPMLKTAMPMLKTAMLMLKTTMKRKVVMSPMVNRTKTTVPPNS